MAAVAFLAGRGDATRDPGRDDLDAAESMSRAQAGAVERVRDAVVSVHAIGKDGEEFGAGIVIQRSGAILTAFHVVRGATTVTVRTFAGDEHVAHVAGTDRDADLALLRVEARLQPARLGRDEGMRPGETVLAVGNPFGLYGTVTRGVLSARGRRNVIRDNIAPLLQTDAALNPGSSGGALINLRGDVVGMVTAIMTKNGGHQGAGFAVPATELRHALPFLLRGEDVQRSWLGVHIRTVGGLEEGLEVVKTTAGGPAALAGLEPGDVILRLQNERVGDVAALRRILRATRVGDEVHVSLRRGDRLLTITLRTQHLTKT